MARRTGRTGVPGDDAPQHGSAREQLSARAALARARPHVVIDPTAHVRVNFDVAAAEGAAGVPFFECLPCEDLLAWSPDERYWICPACGYELTPAEARVLLAALRTKIGYLEQYVDRKDGVPARAARKGFLAWLLGLWSRKARRSALSSRSSGSG